MKQRSTCRWCRRVIERETERADWEAGSLVGPRGNPECEAAPNPDDGPMPHHEPGTAVMNEDGTVAQ